MNNLTQWTYDYINNLSYDIYREDYVQYLTTTKG